MSIEVNQLSKTYGDQFAVKQLSFQVQKGEIMGFLGPNGAGKTTTMKMITGILAPDSGTASICGYTLEEDPIAYKRCIGYLPENNPLYSDMYIQEYLHHCGAIYQLSNLKQRIAEVIEMTGVGPEMHKKINELSKGYKQRVGLAQAILHNPEVLILDEPTSGLDPNQLVEIRNTIRAFGQDKVVLFSTHIMQEVEAICNRVLIIHQGAKVADCSIDQLQQLSTSKVQLLVRFQEPVAIQSLNAIKVNRTIRHHLKDNTSFIFETQNEDALRQAIFTYASNNNIVILDVQRQTQQVEDVFRELTKNTQVKSEGGDV